MRSRLLHSSIDTDCASARLPADRYAQLPSAFRAATRPLIDPSRRALYDRRVLGARSANAIPASAGFFSFRSHRGIPSADDPTHEPGWNLAHLPGLARVVPGPRAAG